MRVTLYWLRSMTSSAVRAGATTGTAPPCTTQAAAMATSTTPRRRFKRLTRHLFLSMAALVRLATQLQGLHDEALGVAGIPSDGAGVDHPFRLDGDLLVAAGQLDV